MCESMEQLRKESERIGEEKGLQNGRLTAFIDMVRDGMLTIAYAAERLGISEQEFRAKMRNM